MATFLLAAFIVPAFSQDDDTVVGKVLDAGNHIGKAEIITDAGNDFGLYIKM